MAIQVPILILAAGYSRRLGRPKQFIELNGKLLIQHVVDEAIKADIGRVYVLTGYQSDTVKTELGKRDIKFIINPQWREGMGSSIRKGVEKVMDEGWAGLIISVCDQPFINAKVFRNLKVHHETSGKGIIYSEYDPGYGPPVYFNGKYFDELLSLKGDWGAKSIIKKHTADTGSISFSDGKLDIDTKEDYFTYMKRI